MTTEHSDNRRAADTIASAIYAAVQDLCVSMPDAPQPYDYSPEFNRIGNELNDICIQLERIADHLEAKG